MPPPEELPPFEDELVGAAVAPPLHRDDPVPDAPVLALGATAGPPPVPDRPPHPRAPRIDRKRLAVVYDIDGPRVRLGVAWFVAALAATLLSPFTAAVAFAVAAGFAGRQIVRAWGSVSWQADVAAGIAAVPVLAAAVAGVPGAVGAAVLGVAVAIGAASAPDGGRFAGGAGRVAAAGIMMLALVPALGAACVVLVRADSVIAAVVLVVVASAYELGDYIVGSGASNPIEGPLAGITTATLVALPLALVLVEPFDTGGVALLVFVAAACPLGQILASAALPGAGAPRPRCGASTPCWCWPSSGPPRPPPFEPNPRRSARRARRSPALCRAPEADGYGPGGQAFARFSAAKSQFTRLLSQVSM